MPQNANAYLLLVRDTTPEVYEGMSPADVRTALEAWNEWCDRMAGGGALRDGRPLGGQARLVSGQRGERVTDGPYTEAKELVGGYFLLEGVTLEEATGFARLCPLLPYGMTVEIRPVVAACHLATALGWDEMRSPPASD